MGATLDANNPDLRDASVANVGEMCDAGWDEIWIDNLGTIPDDFLTRLIDAAHAKGKRIGGNFVTLDSQSQLELAKRLIDLGLDSTFDEFFLGGAWDDSQWSHPEDLAKQWIDYSHAHNREWQVRCAAGTTRQDWLQHCWAKFAEWNTEGLGRFVAVTSNPANDPRHIWPASAYQ